MTPAEKTTLQKTVTGLLVKYRPASPRTTADALRKVWRSFEARVIHAIKASEREKQETLGTPVPVLKVIGQAVAKAAKKDVDAYLPLARLLWDAYGREGRVVAVYPLGALELARPEQLVPLLRELCRGCHTWEDADQLAMYGVELIVLKDPKTWLPVMGEWLADENFWVRRAGATVIGRVARKRTAFAGTALEMLTPLLVDETLEVKRAVSFAIRLVAHSSPKQVLTWMKQQVPPQHAAATWTLCDVIRSMAKRQLPEFRPLAKPFAAWAKSGELDARHRRSIESAAKLL